MTAIHGLDEYVGFWAIASVTRPVVWPFLCHAVVDIQPASVPAQAYIRVRTAGGALLRGYSARFTTRGNGLVLTCIEGNGRTYDLGLVLRSGQDGRRGLVGTWTDAATGAASVAEGVWTAEEQDDAGLSVAA